MPSPFVGGRIPESLKQKLDEYLAATGKNQADAIREAIALLLDEPLQPNLEYRVAQIEEKMGNLEARLGEFIA